MEKLEKLAEAIIASLTGKSIGYGMLLGLVISLCLTSVTILLLAGMPAMNQHPPIENGWSFLGEFLLLFTIITSIAVLMNSRENNAKQREADVAAREAGVAERERAVAEREADDLLSAFRQLIAGVWTMKFKSWKYGVEGEPDKVSNNTYAKFDVNPRTKKLVMRTQVTSDGEFDEENILIEAISIWPVVGPKHLDYFHDLTLSHENGDVVRGPVFVHLDIEFEDDRPVRLKGTWYDLDGIFSRVVKNSFVRAHGPVHTELPLRGPILFTKLDAQTTDTSETSRRPFQTVRAQALSM